MKMKTMKMKTMKMKTIKKYFFIVFMEGFYGFLYMDFYIFT